MAIDHKLRFIVLQLIVLTQLVFAQDTEDPICLKKGECRDSILISDTNDVDTYRNCLLLCNENESCKYFTYYPDINHCVQFLNCVQFSNTSCSSCYSGETGCSIKEDCFSYGKCVGTFVESSNEEEANDCLQRCKENSECKWFDFNRQNYGCTLLKDCVYLDQAYKNHLSGPEECDPVPETTKILISGGASTDEFVDLSSADTSCVNPEGTNGVYDDSFPLRYNDQPVICGDTYRGCYIFDLDTKIWEKASFEISYDRDFAASVELGYNYHWIIGGNYRDTTEFFKDGKFENGPILPEQSSFGCAVKINSSFVFYGAYDVSSAEESDKTFLVNVKNDFEFIELPDLKQERRDRVSCGLTIDEDGSRYIIVSGGFEMDIIERINLDSPSEWEIIEPLDHELYASAYIQFKNYFVTFGGRYGSSVVGDIIKYQNKGEAVTLDQTLVNSRDYGFAFTIPESYVTCE